MRIFATLAVFLAVASAQAQWTIQDAHTTADLRGIHSIGNGIAWASGTHGTVLRTTDDGTHWQTCAMPPDAEKSDLRGIQAFDAVTAVVMSSEKGYLSRIYKTTDACKSWKLVFTNPDKDGYFNAVQLTHGKRLDVLGDAVRGKFAMFFAEDAGDTWYAVGESGRDAPAEAHIFSASNSALLSIGSFAFFGTGAGVATPPQIYRTRPHCGPTPENPKASPMECVLEWTPATVPLGSTGTAAGVLSLAARDNGFTKDGLPKVIVVAVGGSNDQSAQNSGTCAISEDGGQSWTLASTPTHGFRSAVAYDQKSKTWIAVGFNGTDISTDDGHTWRALIPGSTDEPNADKNWNALSLPFAVGRWRCRCR